MFWLMVLTIKSLIAHPSCHDTFVNLIFAGANLIFAGANLIFAGANLIISPDRPFLLLVNTQHPDIISVYSLTFSNKARVTLPLYFNTYAFANGRQGRIEDKNASS